MKINRDMKLKDGVSEDDTTDDKHWTGYYSTIESNNIVVRLCANIDSHKQWKNVIEYTVIRLKKRRGSDSYWMSAMYEGTYDINEDDTFEDLFKWIRENVGYTLYEKQEDISKYDRW